MNWNCGALEPQTSPECSGRARRPVNPFLPECRLAPSHPDSPHVYHKNYHRWFSYVSCAYVAGWAGRNFHQLRYPKGLGIRPKELARRKGPDWFKANIRAFAPEANDQWPQMPYFQPIN